MLFYYVKVETWLQLHATESAETKGIPQSNTDFVRNFARVPYLKPMAY